MKLWKVEITAIGPYCSSSRRYTYTGTATTAEIALRQMNRKAKKDGLTKVKTQLVECLGEKEFGR